MGKGLLHGRFGDDAAQAPFGKCKECHANAQLNDYGECYHCEMEQEVYRLEEVIDALKLLYGDASISNDELVAIVQRQFYGISAHHEVTGE